MFAGLGRFKEALAGFEEGQSIWSGFGQEAEVALCTMNRAVALAHLGRFEEALADYERTHAVFVRFGQKIEAARCTVNRANVFASLGRFKGALAGLRRGALGGCLGQKVEATRC